MIFLLGYPTNAPVIERYGLIDRRMHQGIDYQTGAGDPVLSSGAGLVVLSQFRGCRGLVVTIDHGDGIATTYYHLGRSLVRPGEQIKAGQAIALTACPKLHFGVIVSGSFVDPDKAVAFGIDRETGELNHPRLIKSILTTATLAGIMIALEG